MQLGGILRAPKVSMKFLWRLSALLTFSHVCILALGVILFALGNTFFSRVLIMVGAMGFIAFCLDAVRAFREPGQETANASNIFYWSIQIPVYCLLLIVGIVYLTY